MKLAVYGKGGIGKSTISANITAALAEEGYRLLHIGCDPKHDSTRLLLGDTVPKTVLEYVKNTLPEERRLSDILFSGYRNTACVEAGGPEPGVGCAGRGIITMFDLLAELGIGDYEFDITLFDVLGDVVCGGFAVPVRREYADAVFIVTSGEFMSLYAANNILRGIQNFSHDKGRVAGIIFNERGLDGELDRVTRFAKAVSLPLLAHIPRSSLFARAEREGKTIIELFPDTPEAGIIRNIAAYISTLHQSPAVSLPAGAPLSDQDRDLLLLGNRSTCRIESFRPAGEKSARAGSAHSPSVRNKRPLIGCAFVGAVVVTTQLAGAATVVHAPKSCSLMIHEKIIATEIRASQVSGIPYHASPAQALYSSDLTDTEFIHGGEQRLRETIEAALTDGYTWIFVITACAPGLNGDRVREIIDRLSVSCPDIRFIPILVDGNIVGDFSQGMIEAYRAIFAQLPPPGDQAGNKSVTLIAERFFAPNEERNIEVIGDLLSRLGIDLTCRLFHHCPVKSLSMAADTALFLPTEINDFTVGIGEMIRRVIHRPILRYPLPVGFRETAIWLREIASMFDCADLAEEIISEAERQYEDLIAPLRTKMAGKTLLVSTQRRSVDWVLDLATDLGMIILRVGLQYSPFNDLFQSRYENQVEFCPEYDITKRAEDIRTRNPDLVLYTYPHLSAHETAHNTMIPYTPGFGFFAGLYWAERWNRILQVPAVEGWKYDGEGML